MTAHNVVEAVLLSLVVLSCWLGSIGMWRMREPVQALHYISLPACLGSTLLVVAVYLQTGMSQATVKMVLICLVLLAINSVVTHATARAFRTRELGHWQPRKDEGIERVTKTEGEPA